MDKKLLLALGLVALAGQISLSSPTIGKHHLSFRLPSLSRNSKNQRANSMSATSTKSDSDSISGSSRERKDESSLPRHSSIGDIGAALPGDSQFKVDCSREAFEKASDVAKSKVATGLLSSVDNYMGKYFKRCETLLAREVINLKLKNNIQPEQEHLLDHFRELIKQSEDHTDFESDRMDRHVPKRNLSVALLEFMSEKKKLIDPRSDKHNFKGVLKGLYEHICSPINDEFRALLAQYDILDKMSHLLEATAESEDNLIEWMANARICSYIPNEVEDLMQDTADLLLTELGDEFIPDPEEEYADLATIFD